MGKREEKDEDGAHGKGTKRKRAGQQKESRGIRGAKSEDAGKKGRAQRRNRFFPVGPGRGVEPTDRSLPPRITYMQQQQQQQQQPTTSMAQHLLRGVSIQPARACPRSGKKEGRRDFGPSKTTGEACLGKNIAYRERRTRRQHDEEASVGVFAANKKKKAVCRAEGTAKGQGPSKLAVH